MPPSLRTHSQKVSPGRAVLALIVALGCARSAVEHRMPLGVTRDVPLAGVTLHTVELGTRPRPVRYILHDGWGFDHSTLRPWLDFLADDGRAVYIDIRGHGRSSAPPDAEGYALTAAGDDLAELARVRRDGPVDVVGHGLGGTIALIFAARHPETVRRVVLIDPLRDGSQIRALDARGKAALGETGWARLRALLTPQGTLRDSRNLPVFVRGMGALWWHTVPSMAVVQQMTRGVVYRPDAAANFDTDALSVDTRITAADVRAPTLVVSGNDDRVYLPGESRALAAVLPHGSYAQIAPAGHLPYVEAPGIFARVVRDFLGSGLVSE